MKAQFFAIVIIASTLLYACAPSYSKITSTEFVPIEFHTLFQNKESVVLRPNIAVCYNKYYNESALPTKFQEKYSTDTISYGKQMVVELFLGNQNKYKEVSIGKILENRNELRIYFEAIENEDAKTYYQPFTLAKIHKTRKNVNFFLNDEDLSSSIQSIYVK